MDCVIINYLDVFKTTVEALRLLQRNSFIFEYFSVCLFAYSKWAQKAYFTLISSTIPVINVII